MKSPACSAHAVVSVATLALLVLGAGTRAYSPATVLCDASEPPRSISFDAATAQDPGFNKAYCHGFRTIQGVQMHYVYGEGKKGGPVFVFLHGWPQSWFEFRGVLPDFAVHGPVLALDLPGMGDTAGSPPDMAKATLAAYVKALVDDLGLGPVHLVTHDLGVGVGWAYAALYPKAVKGLAMMDYILPSSACPAFTGLFNLAYQFAFYRQPVAEHLILPQVELYLREFVTTVTANPAPLSESELQEFVRTYQIPSVLRNGLGLYRTMAQDQQDNEKFAKTAPLETPLLLLTQSGFFDTLTQCFAPGVAGGNALQGQSIEGYGHWLIEEAPEIVVPLILEFFGVD